MKALMVKILKGSYPELPRCYSEDLHNLIEVLLQKEPDNRPTIKNVL